MGIEPWSWLSCNSSSLRTHRGVHNDVRTRMKQQWSATAVLHSRTRHADASKHKRPATHRRAALLPIAEDIVPDNWLPCSFSIASLRHGAAKCGAPTAVQHSDHRLVPNYLRGEHEESRGDVAEEMVVTQIEGAAMPSTSELSIEGCHPSTLVWIATH